eukprot:s3790_g19.t1
MFSAKGLQDPKCRLKSRKTVGLPKDSPTDSRTDPSDAEDSKYRLMLVTLEPLLRLMENETLNLPAVHLRLCGVHRHT